MFTYFIDCRDILTARKSFIFLSNKEMYNQRIHDLHENPERAGFVKHPIDWKHSSAIDYYTEKEKGLLELIRLD